MWSMGCIFAELLWCYEAKVNPKGVAKKRVLFPGNSCYPLSPRNGDEQVTEDEIDLSSKDQLKIICRTIGTPSTMDRSFISSEQSEDYLKYVCEHRHKNKLEKIFPSASPDAISLLKGLLEFNPHFRLSAKEALQSPLFDKIRQKHFEQPCPIKI